MKQLVGRLRVGGQSGSELDVSAEPDVTANPTPIRISKRTRTALMLALLGLVIWQVPSVLTTVVGGFALALALSFPIRWLSRLMPRGLAILASFLLLVVLVVSAVYRFAPNRHLTLRSVVSGASLAVALWALGLTVLPDYGVAYGSLGTAISLLLYLYVSASAVLLGAEVNAAMLRESLDAARSARGTQTSRSANTARRGD